MPQINCLYINTFIDIDASVRLTLDCTQRILRSRDLVLDPPDLFLCGLSSKPVTPLGKHPFDLYLAGDLAPLNVPIYIFYSDNLLADNLLGNFTRHGVDIFPSSKLFRYEQRYNFVFSTNESSPQVSALDADDSSLALTTNDLTPPIPVPGTDIFFSPLL